MKPTFARTHVVPACPLCGKVCRCDPYDAPNSDVRHVTCLNPRCKWEGLSQRHTSQNEIGIIWLCVQILTVVVTVLVINALR